MVELLFPLAAVSMTFLVLIPALTLMSRVLLRFRRSRERVWARFGSEVTFALLVAPTVIPVSWLVSSAAHQSEPSQSLESCLVDHVTIGSTVGSASCTDALLLVAVVALGVMVVALLRARLERPGLKLHRVDAEHPEQRRIERIRSLHPDLARVRVAVVAHSAEPVVTTGFIRPECFLDTCFVESADDKMLLAALLHESAHMSAFDNLRCFIVRLALTVNPAGRLLAGDFRRWRQAREADCDGSAVFRGGEPLALAQSIIHAAKFRCAGPLACGISALCGADAAALKLRVALLFEGPPQPQRTSGHLLLLVAVVAALGLPHLESFAFLEQFHIAVERLAHPHS